MYVQSFETTVDADRSQFFRFVSNMVVCYNPEGNCWPGSTQYRVLDVINLMCPTSIDKHLWRRPSSTCLVLLQLNVVHEFRKAVLTELALRFFKWARRQTMSKSSYADWRHRFSAFCQNSKVRERHSSTFQLQRPLTYITRTEKHLIWEKAG